MAETLGTALPAGRTPSWGRAAGPGRLDSVLPHVALASLFLLGYTVLAALRYQRFGSPSWDLGIFTEAVKGYAHFHAPVVSIKGPGFNALGDHWSPVLALLAPFFWLFPSAMTLLVAQAALFAWSVGVVSDSAARVLTRNRGLLIGTAYGLSWGLQRAVDAEFHEIAFAVPLLALVGRQLLLGRWERAAWWALPLVLVKEDMGLTVAAVGVVLALTARRWFTAGVLVVFGLGFTALTVFLLIPHFNPQHHFDYWSKLPGGTHPKLWQVLSGPFTRLTVWKTTGWLFGIVGFLALRSPLVVLALPTLAWRFGSSNPMFWGPDWHYNATLMPILFLALVDAVQRLGRSARPGLRAFADGMVPAAPGIAVACLVSLPVGFGGLADPAAWSGGQHAAVLRAAIAQIPPDVRVESSMGPLAQLAARDDTYWLGGCTPVPPEYLLVDRDGWGDAPTDMPGYASALHPGARYGAVFDRGGVVVLRRLP
ncbi:hypothetical protein P3T37_004311 [Kitasatospora sp. MAA4]|uniref:DUF2079 domain-containing protein n=1 Tax=Kitasatospora sp. MAA4 TaxID=3035093 RepID=UPI0024766165|nr:DUF2079 domain-containing protein [Kitasatospora sp. MAA4]MDH6134902.1 hypothetical protein [Kitasatospora sp. MAA4]